jgi:MoaA/NifB/PqqE/SkfB family radical SAM enzyme
MNPFGRVRACGRSVPNLDNPSLKDISIAEAWNSDYYKQLRLDMLAGLPNKNCEKCYLQEQLGGYSKRMQINDTTSFDINYYKNKTAADGSTTIAPSRIDIRVGNICNLKCVHCWTGNSSKWYEDKLLLDKYENTTNYKINNKWISEKGSVWQYVRDNCDTINSLNILGGEPFASKEHNQLIDWLIENDKLDIELCYVSNGTLLYPDVIDKLKKFKHVELGISLDDIHERAEFVRFPTKWNRLEENLKYINESFNGAYLTWSCYNINFFHLAETYKYCADNFTNMDFRLGDFVNSPAHMSVQNLPLSFKHKILDRTKSIPGVKFFINYMLADDLWFTHKDTFFNYLDDLDVSRKTNWKTLYPEIAILK